MTSPPAKPSFLTRLLHKRAPEERADPLADFDGMDDARAWGEAADADPRFEAPPQPPAAPTRPPSMPAAPAVRRDEEAAPAVDRFADHAPHGYDAIGDLDVDEAHDAAPMARPGDGPGLVVRGVEKTYKKRKVVGGVSLTVHRGEAVGLLGPNGAGKTTVFYMITGLIRPDAGRIELDGFDITALPMYRRARLGIGYLPQEASIFRGLSVEENILAVLEVVEKNKKRRLQELDALLDEFRIGHLRKSPSIALSGGERRRCEIARALASRPSFVLLDEPFAGIDPIAVGDIQALVRHLTERGIGVLITDHNVRETLGLIDRAYIIASGQVLTHGTAAEVVANPDVRRLYLGEQFTL